MAKDEAYYEAEKKIEEALQSSATELKLYHSELTELPESISQLTHLTKLNLSHSQLNSLPDSLGQLTQLTELNLSYNQLNSLPDSLGQLMQLTELNLSYNQLNSLPDSLGQLTQLTELVLSFNQLTELPDWIGKLTQLKKLTLAGNQLSSLPKEIQKLPSLKHINLYRNRFKIIPEWFPTLLSMEELIIGGNELTELPVSMSALKNLKALRLGSYETYGNPIQGLPLFIRDLKALEILWVVSCGLTHVPEWIGELQKLKDLKLENNQLTDLPPSLAKLENLEKIILHKNPLNPALQSAHKRGLDTVKAYLRSLENNAEPLYEAKLVLVGEGGVGKTTLLNALMNKEDRFPKKDEVTTHGVKIDVNALQVIHPEKENVNIHFNAWDFGGQEVYRVTHQFFFSRRSLYLLVWEPRRGVQQCQVEDWLNMIRLRVGDEARVLIISTNSKSGGHIARIDQPVFKQQYGDMIVGFYEVDSLVNDEKTNEKVGIAELKKVIATEAIKLNHVGMLFNNDWKAAHDELITCPDAHISYKTFMEVCSQYKLSEIDTLTLAGIMNDLGHIVHYSDDEKLQDDVVLKPEWLTKAIGFVLEDRATAEREGILPDNHLYKVWYEHSFNNEPKYDSSLYPFFLRLMEKYDVCYRLPEDRKSSLVAQHVPQVRPELPWLPEQNPPENLRRIAMVCTMEEDPPGLVPWMIVRTHDYAVEQNNHRLHWQKGMFLSHGTHGEAMLEKRDREFHVYTQAEWPEYFMNIVQHTLQKLIDDNWPGLKDRYRFMVPCPEIIDNQSCKGRFNINALRQFLAEGDSTVRCQECSKKQSIVELLFGFEERPVDIQLREIKEQLAGMDSRIANYFMATMNAIADEAKNGPRLFTFHAHNARFSAKQIFSHPLELQLWCEAEGCQHPVREKDKGVYSIDQPREWVTKIAPYANFALKVLSTVAPLAAPAINTFFGSDMTKTWKIDDQLDLANAIIDQLPEEIKISDRNLSHGKVLSEPERSGILALHNLLKDLDPTQTKLGLHRVNTYTGDYRWLCKHHYDAWQPKIPDVIQTNS